MAIERGFTSTICVRGQFTITIMNENLCFIRASFLTRLTNRLVISDISQTNDSSATLSKLTCRNRIASSVGWLITNTFVKPRREFIISVSRLFNIRVEGARRINRLIVILLKRFTFMGGGHVIGITTLSGANLRRQLGFTCGRRDATYNSFVLRLHRILRHYGLIKRSIKVM